MSHGNLIDLVGKTFNELTVIKRAPNRGCVMWECICSCGTVKVVAAKHLTSGATISCGCKYRTRAGLSMTREYDIWKKMLARCYNESNNNYRYYGAKGTRVCQRWRESAEAFIEDLRKSPSDEHTIDRKNTHGHYTCGKCDECVANGQPPNCRWVTRDVQHRNQRSNRRYTHNGKTLILKDWARLSGVDYHTLWGRIHSGVPFAEAISLGRYDRKGITKAKSHPSDGV